MTDSKQGYPYNITELFVEILNKKRRTKEKLGLSYMQASL